MSDTSEQPEQVEKMGLNRLLYIIIWTFRLYLKSSPFKTSFLLITSILLEIRGLIYTYLFASVLDQIISLIQSGSSDIRIIYPYLWELLIYMIIFEAFASNAYRYFRRSINQSSRYQIERIYYIQINSLGIQTLENPDTINLLKRADLALYDSVNLLEESISFISNIVVAVSAGFIISKFLPVMIPIIVIYAVLTYIPENHFMKKDYRWQVNNTEPKRMANMNSYVLGDPTELQEVKINNSFGFFDSKYQEFIEWYLGGLLKIIRDSQLTRFTFSFFEKFINIYAYYRIIMNAVSGLASAGSVIFQIRSIDYFSSSVSDVLGSITYINEFGIKMNDVIKVFELKPLYKDGVKKLGTIDKSPEIEFRNVSFKYPNSDKFIFENLNIKIESGERIAIVGHNGAGKTTLVKLIAKIYPVTSGEILINGINLKDIKTSEWYQHLGILFQEFHFHNHLTAKENIYLGNPSKPIDEERIVESAINADADDFIREYKNGYDQLMSEKYKGGVRPSTGQMQKIAIAKFFYRNAPVAIFDEPTAAIDAVSEYKIFNKIYSFFERKSVIIISHRFSTVRNADRIIVIEKGKIVEEGSHAKLLEKNGTYAHAFNLQAEGYRTEVSTLNNS
jgi:ABC-type multidrug transport system fused ATPase/permease subunit